MAVDPISLGIQIALMAAQTALSASRKIDGPRVTELDVTLADYGTPIPEFAGLRKLDGCPIFWAEKLKEVKSRTKTKGGKYNDYTYFGSWAVAVADHEIEKVTRIWFDRHLVYDATGTGPLTPFVIGYSRTTKSGGQREVAVNLIEHFRVYTGTETQEPDPRMLASVEAEFGADSCPAYRGLAWLMFEDVPLEKFGNRIPTISVEAATAVTAVYPYETVTGPDTGALYQRIYSFTPDFQRLWFSGMERFEVWDVPSRTLLTTGSFAGLSSPYPHDKLAFQRNGGVLFVRVGSDRIIRLPPEGVGIQTVFADLAIGQNEVRVFVDGNDNEHWMTRPSVATDPIYLDGAEIDVSAATGLTVSIRDFFVDRHGDIWVVGSTSGTAAVFYRIVDAGARPGSLGMFHVTSGLTGGSNNIAASHFTDGVVDHFILNWSGGIYAIDINTGSVDFSRTAALTVHWILNLLPDATSAYIDEAEVSLADLTDVRIYDLADWAGAGATSPIYDPINQALMSAGSIVTAPQVRWLALDRATGASVTLGSIVQRVAAKAEIAAGDIITTALTQSVRGYSWTRSSGKDILDPLLEVHDVDARPHGFQLEFLPRGGAIGTTINSADFALLDADEPEYAVDNLAGSDLPRHLTISFADNAADQAQGSATAARPLDSSDSAGVLSIDLSPLVLSPDEGKRFAERLLRRRWFGASTLTLALTSQQLALEPGDLRVLNCDGVPHRARLTSMALDADEAISTEWERDDPAVAVLSGSTGAVQDGHVPAVILVPQLSKGFVLDLPLAIDAHDQSQPFAYFAASPFASGLWPGSEIHVSDSGAEDDYAAGWATIASNDAARWGVSADVLENALPWNWDRVSAVAVRMQYGEPPVSTTEVALLNDGSLNLVLLGDEYFQYATRTLQLDGSWRLSTLLRGLRGTEQHIAGHIAGEQFLVIDTAIARRVLGAGEIGDTDFYKAVTPGRDTTGALPVELAFGAAAHRPYAAVHGALRLSAGDWSITATRRSRIGGFNIDGQSVPLGEVSEAWEADVMDGAVVKRTLSGASLPLVYTAAMQTTDWGGAQTSLDVNVYQMSPALALRGFPLAIAA